MKEKKLTIFMAFISVALCASIALSVIMLFGQKNTEKKIEKISGLAEDVNQEDDVTIAGEYEIKSTLPISDAYKSGDTSKLNDSEKETLDMAKDILDEIIEDDMSDYEKEKAVYEWLTNSLTNSTGILTVIPTNNGDNDNPHDVLKYHSAVCVGYATTFRMFMQMLDIECKVIHSSDLVHSWDLVKLDDGWYHTDCYMDSDTHDYRNFNMDDNRCASGHDWTREYFPAANGQKYNYIFSICEELESIYDVPAWLVDAVDERESMISCTFEEEINEENENAAQYMVDRLVSLMEGEYSIGYDWMLNDDNKYVLCFYIDYYDDEPTYDDVDDETVIKIDEAISDALGIDADDFDNYDGLYENYEFGEEGMTDFAVANAG
jgi:hypothetical protein